MLIQFVDHNLILIKVSTNLIFKLYFIKTFVYSVESMYSFYMNRDLPIQYFILFVEVYLTLIIGLQSNISLPARFQYRDFLHTLSQKSIFLYQCCPVLLLTIYQSTNCSVNIKFQFVIQFNAVNKSHWFH